LNECDGLHRFGGVEDPGETVHQMLSGVLGFGRKDGKDFNRLLKIGPGNMYNTITCGECGKKNQPIIEPFYPWFLELGDPKAVKDGVSMAEYIPKYLVKEQIPTYGECSSCQNNKELIKVDRLVGFEIEHDLGNGQKKKLSEGHIKQISKENATVEIEVYINGTKEKLSKVIPLSDLKYKGRATKAITLPEAHRQGGNIVIIGMKRFTNDFETWAEVKIGADIEFPHEFEYEFASGQKTKFRLKAATVHSGDTARSGHYTSLLLKDGKYSFWDDRDTTLKDMKASIGNEQKMKKSYFLAYEIVSADSNPGAVHGG